jgi:hypothetical protein
MIFSNLGRSILPWPTYILPFRAAVLHFANALFKNAKQSDGWIGEIYLRD